MKDVFLCHVSEDKDDIVRPLYEALESAKITCWFDDAEIKWGDSVVKKVNDGLNESKYLVVILSHNFINKNWVFRELNSMLNKEASTGNVRVLPLLCGSDDVIDNILETLPIINDKSYLIWNGNPNNVIQEFKKINKNLTFNEKEEIIRKKITSVLARYGVIGSLCGFIIDQFVFWNINTSGVFTVLGICTAMIYGYIINFFYKGNTLEPMSFVNWKNSSKKRIYNLIPLLPNILCLPFMGGVLGDFLYETYEATIIGTLLAFSFGLFVRFKLGSVTSAIIWTIFGMFIALGYNSGEESDAIERFKYYGTLGAFLGILFSVFIGILIGAVQGLLDSKPCDKELVEE